MKNKCQDFYIVSLTDKKILPWKLILTIFSMLIVVAVSKVLNGIATTFPIFLLRSFLSLIITFIKYFILVFIGRFYWKHRQKYPYPSVDLLFYFLNSNHLYETDNAEKYVKGRLVREKYISNSAVLGCKEDDKTITVRAYKRGDIFTDKMNCLDTGLSALFHLEIDNKQDTVSYCDYVFRKTKDRRIVVRGNREIEYNDTVYLPLNNNLSWNILKQPHLLLAGVTGSGKTTFINYLIVSMKKMRGTVYVCDPKRSDLSSLKHYWSEKYVASEVNTIARLTREVKDIMENRFIEYKENSENFVYGNSFVDYGLKPVFLIFDELGAYRAGADKKVFAETMDNLTQIILKGREMGVFCVLSTQQPNANNIPTELRDNLSVRLAMGNMSAEAYRMVFGECELKSTVNEVGAGYIYLDGLGWEKPKYFQAPFLDYKSFDFITEIRRYQQ